MKALYSTTDINEILNSQNFVKETGGSREEFKSPKELLNPVLKSFEYFNYSGFASHPVSIGLQDDESNILTAYGRAGLIASFDIDEEMTYQIGFLYALELGKPMIKAFSGFNVSICSNMCVFNAKNQVKYEMHNITEAYSKIEEFLYKRAEEIERGKKIISLMKNTQLDKKEIHEFFGKLLFNFTAVKNIAGTNCINNAAKLLTDRNTHYFFENVQNCWKIYNALTDGYGKTHIFDHQEKVLAIYEQMLTVLPPIEEEEKMLMLS